MTFRDVRLDKAIGFGAVGGPGFETVIVATENAHESRDPTRQYEVGSWDISYAARLPARYKPLQRFFRAIAHGRAYTWRFHDELDYKVETGEGVFIDNGDGTFQFAKKYEVDGFSYIVPVTLPIQDTVDIEGTGDYTVEWIGGLLTVNSGADPIGWTGERDKHARFDTDQMRATQVDKKPSGDPIVTWAAIPIVEVLEPPEVEAAPTEVDTYYYRDRFTGSGNLDTHDPDVGSAYVLGESGAGALTDLTIDGSGNLTLNHDSGSPFTPVAARSTLTGTVGARYDMILNVKPTLKNASAAAIIHFFLVDADDDTVAEIYIRSNAGGASDWRWKVIVGSFSPSHEEFAMGDFMEFKLSIFEDGAKGYRDGVEVFTTTEFPATAPTEAELSPYSPDPTLTQALIDEASVSTPA